MPDIQRLIAVLTPEPPATIVAVFERCEAAKALGAMGPRAMEALPELVGTLLLPLRFDCGWGLRVFVAEAIWRISGRDDIALPYLTWAMRDEHNGLARIVAEILTEMGPRAHDAVPELVWLAQRWLTHGPFLCELTEPAGDKLQPKARPLLAVIARALGQCRGVTYGYEAGAMLQRLMNETDGEVQTAASHAMRELARPV